MKVGALIVGLIGGIIALGYGIMGYALGSLAEGSGGGPGLKIVSIAVPVVALVGAGMAMSKPLISAALLGLSAVVFIVILGFNTFTLIPVVLLAIGAGLAFFGYQETEKTTAGRKA